MAMAMEAVGEEDVNACGALTPQPGIVLLAGQMIIGLEAGNQHHLKHRIMRYPGFKGSEGSLLAIGDSAVCANPDSGQLAGIAVSACDTVRDLLGWEPKCAMVSYSTLGSGQGNWWIRWRRRSGLLMSRGRVCH
ncbi:MAG: phosphate acyltransferase [Enterocloster clostridioformis]